MSGGVEEAEAGRADGPAVLPAGQDALLVRFALTALPGAMAAAQRYARALADDPPAGATEIVPGLVSVLVRFDPRPGARAALAAALRARLPEGAATDAPPPPRRRWHVPAAFGGDAGPGLDAAARAAGCGPEAAVATFCGTDLRILAIGFAPGQPYLGLLPEAWDLPRLSDLTPRVPAGAIVLAVRQFVVFGAPSATGWRHVGRTALRTFLPDRDPPMPLRAGDALRFHRIGAEELAALETGGDPMGGARREDLG